MSNPTILYCGDTSLITAAQYLAGLMTHWGWEYRYVPSHQPLMSSDIEDIGLFILSDYPAARVSGALQHRLLAAVEAGAGLLMIGGWESLHGLGGDWDAAPLASALPVEMQSTDDRVNCDQPALVRQSRSHAAVDGLPWLNRPTLIGGFNRFRPRTGSQVLLEVDRLRPSFHKGVWSVEIAETHPLLVVGQHGAGMTAAIATDVAPHWVGGLVDWGEGRVSAQPPGGDAIEVGDLYARFLKQLLSSMMPTNALRQSVML
jgi:hypothetical protein